MGEPRLPDEFDKGDMNAEEQSAFFQAIEKQDHDGAERVWQAAQERNRAEFEARSTADRTGDLGSEPGATAQLVPLAINTEASPTPSAVPLANTLTTVAEGVTPMETGDEHVIIAEVVEQLDV